MRPERLTARPAAPAQVELGRASIGAGSSHPIGSPNFGLHLRVRTSGGDLTTS
jgi:hypothetical protein